MAARYNEDHHPPRSYLEQRTREVRGNLKKIDAFEGFPPERLDAVQPGDFAEALRLIHLLLSGDPDMPTYVNDIREAEAYLARLAPEPEGE